MRDRKDSELTKELAWNRRLLIFTATVYLLWWFAVERILPGSFNPPLGRMLVVLSIGGIVILSHLNDFVRRNLRLFFTGSLWLITLHYFYLFFGNAGEENWVVGAFITVMAINLCLFSNRALISYSVFVLFLSVLVTTLLPDLRNSVFLPGIVTILIQANVGLRSRLTVIQRLADSNERFQLLFHSTFEGILVHEGGRIVQTNASLDKILGYGKDELIGRDVLDLMAPSERAVIRENMKKAEVRALETKGLTKNGLSVDIEVRAKNFRHDKHSARLVTIQDIRDRKKAEKERILALTLAENVRIRDEFISIASHELKTPVSALKLQTQIIERDLRHGRTGMETPEEAQEVVGVFKRQIDRLSELVDTMLDVSRISAGRLTLTCENVDLPVLLKEVGAAFRPLLADAASSLTLHVPEHLILRADRRRLKQVIENLLSNAIKYGEGKPISVSAHAEASEVILLVKDDGLGIAQEFIPRIFERFERAIPALNISGLGLGLYIARQIVEAHGGGISVESAVGAGSTFKVRLPL